MSAPFLVIFDGAWRMAAPPDGPKAGPAPLEAEPGSSYGDVRAMKAAMVEAGYRRGGVCLALPSQKVFAARINCDGLPRNHRHEAMLCLLEEQLPLDIEGMTADFMPTAGSWAMGAAVESPKVKVLVDQLEAAGIEVAAICPLALLALWEQCRSGPAWDYVWIASGGKVDVFRMKDGRPAAWYSANDDAQEIVQCVAADGFSNALQTPEAQVCLVGQANWPPDCSLAKFHLKVAAREEETVLALAARAAEQALAGKGAGWIDLRQGALSMAHAWAPVKNLARTAAVLALLLPTLLTAAFLWRGEQYGRIARGAYEQERAAYQKTYPDKPVPAALNRILRTDLAKLTGLNLTAEQLPNQISAIETLRQMVAALPPSIRMRILELRAGPTDVYVEGQTRSHADAEAVNRSLIAAGLAMESPRSENLPSGAVSFTLSGKPIPGVKAAGAAPAPLPVTPSPSAAGAAAPAQANPSP